MVPLTPYIGHVIAHHEFPDLWHLTVGSLDGPRRYLTYCDQVVPLMATVMGELRPTDDPDTGRLPNCAECIRRHLLTLQQVGREAG